LKSRTTGVGFDPGAQTAGFGLAGMNERVYLAGGTLELASDPTGSLLRARLPVRAPESQAGSDADQMAS
jgi:glucose-6-phosphate-specific signal transduction histidine kinase